MLIDWDVPIMASDGLVLRGDVFRPDDDGAYPVLLSYGPYGKGLAFQEGYASAWDIMVAEHPEVAENTSSAYQNWEVADPERWVPDGYVCVRVDSRGTGRSPGVVDPFSARETQDFYDCIEWSAQQSWSSGKVALTGISYYAINQWQVAALQPPHLTCMVPWEGAADFYRDSSYHGGIYCTFWHNWFQNQVKSVQHGLGERGPVSRVTGQLVCGDKTLSDDELAANRVEFGDDISRHPLRDDYHAVRSPDWSKVQVPFLSAGNWGGQGLHLRGNVEAFANAGSAQKWLELHGNEHWTEYYTDYGVALQRQFLAHYLKGEDNGWDRRPPVILRVRTVDGGFIDRDESAWPLAGTEWHRLYLDADALTLTPDVVTTATHRGYDMLGEGLTFWSAPVAADTEMTGPITARLFLSSSTSDADVFVTVRVFSPARDEVLLQGAIDPKTPVAQGWLRASHRRLDPALTTDSRPFHSHDEVQPLTPGEVYQLDVEVWPTSLVIPQGYCLAVTVAGVDFDHGGEGSRLEHFSNELRGCGPFIHVDPRHRPLDVFGGTAALHTGGAHRSYVVLPFIPSERDA